MDSSSLYTKSALINAIQLRALNTPKSPQSSSTQYQIYEQLINNLAIPEWEGQRGIHWNELWVPEDNFTKITANMTSITLPDEYREMGGGFIVLTLVSGTNMIIPVKHLREQVLNPQRNKKECYVSGNRATGFQLVLGWIPQPGHTEIGAAVSFTYYKYALILTNPTDVPEMSDPQFIIFRVVSEVAQLTQNTTVYTTNDTRANNSMSNMVTGNEGSANYQDNYIEDVDALIGRRNVTNRLNSGYWTR